MYSEEKESSAPLETMAPAKFCSEVKYLCNEKGFREQGDLVDAMEANTPTILQNTDSVGNHIYTWVHTNSNEYTI